MLVTIAIQILRSHASVIFSLFNRQTILIYTALYYQYNLYTQVLSDMYLPQRLSKGWCFKVNHLQTIKCQLVRTKTAGSIVIKIPQAVLNKDTHRNPSEIKQRQLTNSSCKSATFFKPLTVCSNVHKLIHYQISLLWCSIHIL